ncbi:zinc-binding alcohol dehydrogenase family protein KNAG_0I02270 [Huiozyma naganishii CBS 8797]|uniref:Enoyl reductase (ER) domain-containing protein n=1 Tax=Huiozyma naganishii (strain ATCC MYA-139 / BCRC 22969 / CBS 8797 / KCTC 17520 / NBRC 10181 / NCYC 3082 / Yp74L-3) TaxID=1071383 RepID=J7RQG4_HUIN7|nr:hypothetical protein KNAG_0I02270 [Kazachstania naganishii CBS 8797]CCK72013.1 hypothetical protein KNAG_0I02270 [Kazachstania naganishii CBS 8797]
MMVRDAGWWGKVYYPHKHRIAMSVEIPSTMKAVVIEGKRPVLKENVALPELEDGFVLLKTRAVAGNPTDWKHIEYGIGPQGAILGCDVAGDIVKLGPNVDPAQFHIGDTLYGFVHGASVRFPTNGAFAEYVAISSKIAYRTPKQGLPASGADSLPEGAVTTLEGAATLPVSLTTAGIVLYHNFGVKLEWEPATAQRDETILLWGGATAVGQPLIQLCKKLHAFNRIVVVASRHHEAQLRQYGADELFDYHDADVVDQIRAKHPNLRHLVDCVSNKGTTNQVYRCASHSDPATVLQLTTTTIADIAPEHKRDNVAVVGMLLYMASGVEVPFGPMTLPADPVFARHAVEFIRFINGKINNGEIHHIPVKVYKGGLAAVPQLTEDIKEGRNSGQKLVAVL